MKKHWKLLSVIALVLGAGYLLFCLAYDAYEDYRRTLPEKELRARTNRIEKAVGDFVAGADSEVPSGAEMLFWEWQSWETGGGRSRLTLWPDGRSEARVWSFSYDSDRFDLEAKPGWKATSDGGATLFVQDPALTAEKAKRLFRNAFRLGVHLLKPAKRDYVDGSGLVIGIQTDGVLNQQTFPGFGPEHWETKNYVRFKALCRLLGEFDVENGFNVATKQKAANRAIDGDKK